MRRGIREDSWVARREGGGGLGRGGAYTGLYRVMFYVQSHCRCYWSGEARMRMRSCDNLGACLKWGERVLTVSRV